MLVKKQAEQLSSYSKSNQHNAQINIILKMKIQCQVHYLKALQHFSENQVISMNVMKCHSLFLPCFCIRKKVKRVWVVHDLSCQTNRNVLISCKFLFISTSLASKIQLQVLWCFQLKECATALHVMHYNIVTTVIEDIRLTKTLIQESQNTPPFSGNWQ